jgi:hypothetical protein
MALIVFALTYNIITAYFIFNMFRDQSASLELAYILLIFWLVAAIALVVLFWMKKAMVNSAGNKLLVFFSTPVPTLLFFFLARLMSSDHIKSSTEYNKNGSRHREIRYHYQSGKLQRVEYYISRDSISTSEGFLRNDVWLKDSTWVYYNEDGSIKKTIKHSQ